MGALVLLLILAAVAAAGGAYVVTTSRGPTRSPGRHRPETVAARKVAG